MSLKHDAARGLKWTTLATLFSSALNTVQLVVLGWLLASPDEFGLMAMVMLPIGLGQACADLTTGIVQRAADERQRSSLFWANLLLGLLVALVIAATAPLAAEVFDAPRVAPLLWVTAAAFLLFPLGKPFEALLQREMQFGVLAVQEAAAGITGCIAAIAIALLGGGVWSLVAAFLASTVTRTAIALAVGLPRYPVRAHMSLADVRPFLGFGLFQIGERALAFLAQRIDQIVIGAVLGSGPLGLYSYAFNLVSTPMTRLNQVIARVCYPLFARVRHEDEKLRWGFVRVLGLIATVDCPLLIGLAVIAPVLVPFALGEKWREATPYVVALSLVVLAKCPGAAIGSLLLAKGKAAESFALNLLVFAGNVPAIWIGGRLGGGVGVALALLAVQVLVKVPNYFWIVRPLVGACGRELARALLEPLALATATGLGVAALGGWTDALAPAVDLAVRIPLAVLAYAVLLAVFDRSRVREILSLSLASDGRRLPRT